MNYKKISVSLAILLFSRLSVKAQNATMPDTKFIDKTLVYTHTKSSYIPNKTTLFLKAKSKNKPLQKDAKKPTDTVTPKSNTTKVEKPVKLSLLSNYYGQDGNRSAVNGGVGSQELHSYTTEIYLTVPTSKKLDINASVGYDEFTSASYLDIDKYQTSASSGGSAVSVDEIRKYGTIGVDLSNYSGSTLFSINGGFSQEYDVSSKTIGLSGSLKNLKTGNVFTLKANAIVDDWMLIYPGEFRTYTDIDGSTGASDKGTKLDPNVTPLALSGSTKTKDGKTYGTDNRLTVANGVNYAFTINKKMNALVGLDYIYQQGLLSTPFYRVYFNDGVDDDYTKAARVENLPDKKMKFTAYGRYNYFFNKMMILRTGARLYSDDWGVNSLTLNAELPIKIAPWVSVMPFYRFYTQTEAKYFKGYGHHNLGEEFYTSDFDLANVYSNKYGASIRLLPTSGLLNIKSFDIRYANYERSDGLNGGSISGGLTFEF